MTKMMNSARCHIRVHIQQLFYGGSLSQTVSHFNAALLRLAADNQETCKERS